MPSTSIVLPVDDASALPMSMGSLSLTRGRVRPASDVAGLVAESGRLKAAMVWTWRRRSVGREVRGINLVWGLELEAWRGRGEFADADERRGLSVTVPMRAPNHSCPKPGEGDTR